MGNTLDIGSKIITLRKAREWSPCDHINDIQKMDTDTQSVLFNIIETYIQNFKTKKPSPNNVK